MNKNGNIDFFCCNSGEIIFYLPVFKYLKNARMVVLNSRYDHQRTKKLLDKLEIPYQEKPSKNVEIVITTQPKLEPWTVKKWRNVPKVRIMYSLCEKNIMHKREFSQPFDLVLVPGAYSHNKISNYTKSTIVGYPKYDNLFNGLIKKKSVIEEFNLDIDEDKKTIFYAPTFNLLERSSIPLLCKEIKNLTNDFNVIFKPHMYTDIKEKNLIKLFENSKVMILNALVNFNKILAISDILIGDIQSGVPWEGIIANKPTIAFYRESGYTFENLEKVLIDEDIIPIVYNPQELKKVIVEILRKPEEFEKKRLFWADKVCSFRNGDAGERSANAIQNLAEKRIKISRQEKIKRFQLLNPNEFPSFNPYIRRIKNFLDSGLSSLKEPSLFIQKIKRNINKRKN